MILATELAQQLLQQLQQMSEEQKAKLRELTRKCFGLGGSNGYR